MKHFLSFILLLTFCTQGLATHNRAGEITYRWKSGFTYEVTITTYTRESVQADRCFLSLSWGDGSSSVLYRTNGNRVPCQNGVDAGTGVPLGNDVRKNEYVGEHSYGSAGFYTLSFEDPNRNAGISNIINSVSVSFYVQSELVIAQGLGGNSSPVLLNPPIDEGCLNQRFEHNAGAFDSIDGDSLSYHLVPVQTSNGTNITTTYDPQYVQDSVRIDSVTGDLIWDAPRNVGQYNFAFQISEWRKGGDGQFSRIGYVRRDMQININTCKEINRPPQIQDVGPFCVEAGQNLNFTVQATDPDGDPVTLRGFGGPFAANPNPADPLATTGTNPASAVFNWNTTCSHVRKQPYYATFEAKDDPSGRPGGLPRLVDLYTAEITVVAPAPENPMAVGGESANFLSWDRSICGVPQGDTLQYKIYRRETSYGFVPGQCETGVPAYTGYELLDVVKGISNTSYGDSIDLIRGVLYCYMVVACFPDGSESYASIEFCTSQPLTFPMMTNVDVLTTDAATGSIDVKWILPPDLDSGLFPPPYSFKLYRADGIEGSSFTEIQALIDTFYTDTGLNTEDQAYRYKVEMYSGANADLLGESDPASSVYLTVSPADAANILRFRHNTPWKNNSFAIFKENPTNSGNFEIIDTTFAKFYIDSGLVNGETYCYKALSIGAYTASDSLPSPLLNHSQEQCAAPLDTTRPCTPVLSSFYECEQDSLYLSWEYPTDSGCTADVLEYRIYFSPSPGEPFGTDFIKVPQGNQFFIFNEPPVIGCYAVTAVDDAGNDPGGASNESLFSNVICAEPCPNVDFPNVFTPNSDGVNDFFKPIDFRNIGSIDIRIFNRWGEMVYQSTHAETFLNQGWDGRDVASGQLCADGVYYYVCVVTPLSLDTPVPAEFTGFVHLFGRE